MGEKGLDVKMMKVAFYFFETERKKETENQPPRVKIRESVT